MYKSIQCLTIVKYHNLPLTLCNLFHCAWHSGNNFIQFTLMQRELSVKDIFWLHSVAAAAGDDATCFSRTVARFMLLPPHSPSAAVPLAVLVRLCCHACVCVPENALQHSSK